MHFKKMLMLCMVSTTIIGGAYAVNATSDLTSVEQSEIADNQLIEEEVETVEITDRDVEQAVSKVEDINIQIDNVYNKVSEMLNLDAKYVKILHVIAGGKTIYLDKKPNVYADETVNTIRGPFEIKGATTTYREMPNISSEDTTIVRPSAYFLPDAAYSVTYDIVQIMNERQKFDRGSLQEYFDALKMEIKKEILFCEAVMIYTGESEEAVNSFYKAYEKMIYDKQKGENIIETSEDGTVKFKEIHYNTLISNGITNEDTIQNLAIILSFSSNIKENHNVDAIKDAYIIPYVANYTSRENMMIAASSVVGKVRYVWGGGHSGASDIDGINPAWAMFEAKYDDTPEVDILDENGDIIGLSRSRSFDECIKPSGSYCPYHGSSSGDCSFKGPYVNNLDEYIEAMEGYLDTEDFKTEKYSNLMRNTNFYKGIAVDTMNGLDCSGFASWVYNQITDKYHINEVATNFTNNPGVKEIPYGQTLLPGDTFGWSTHIIVIVGKTSESGLVYLTVESTPNVIKYGVAYYGGASNKEIEEAKELALNSNKLIGGIIGKEAEPSVFSLDSYIGEGSVGRYKEAFVDENTIIPDYGKSINEMNAHEIIEYVLTKLPHSYVTGYNDYDGTVLDKNKVSSNITTCIE